MPHPLPLSPARPLREALVERYSQHKQTSHIGLFPGLLVYYKALKVYKSENHFSFQIKKLPDWNFQKIWVKSLPISSWDTTLQVSLQTRLQSTCWDCAPRQAEHPWSSSFLCPMMSTMNLLLSSLISLHHALDMAAACLWWSVTHFLPVIRANLS